MTFGTMMRHLMLLCLIFASSVLGADPVTLPNSDVIYLKSKTNDVEYKLYVSYPHDMRESKLEYPLIVTLDPDYSFAIVRNIAEHLSDRHDIPPTVVVGIGYAGETSMRSYRMNRSRDYTPVFDADDGYGPEFQKASGGAPRFLAFIRDELLPMVKEKYRASGKRALVGHSFGGLFATWAMLEEPALFDGYVIVSPSYWYHDRWLFTQEEGFSRTHDALPVQAYLAVGDSEASRMVADFREFVAQMKKSDYMGLQIESEVMSNETHNSLFPRAASNGIRMIWPRETGRSWPAPQTRTEVPDSSP
jgi:predicted alpha/beta superfamily hydrolase